MANKSYNRAKELYRYDNTGSTFDPEGSGYDMDTAIKYGLKANPLTNHWSSREPRTGVILKGRSHPTINKTIKGDREAGYRMIKDPQSGRYFSVPIQIRSDLLDLDKVSQIESSNGQDPASLTPNSKGALGQYGLKSIAVEDIQRVYPEKWGSYSWKEIATNPNLARDAAADYLEILKTYLAKSGMPPTPENLIAAYNWGQKNARQSRGNSKLYPEETRNYINKYNGK